MQGGAPCKRALSWLSQLASRRARSETRSSASLHLSATSSAAIAANDRPTVSAQTVPPPHGVVSQALLSKGFPHVQRSNPSELFTRELSSQSGLGIRGMLSLRELKEKVDEGEIDTVIVGMTDMYGRMVGKRYDAGFFLESAVENGTHACSYLLATDMDMETVPGYKIANWATGYGDDHLQPDLRTLRTCSWLEKTALVLCDVQTEDHKLAPHAPRSILQSQMAESKSLGFQAMAATEVEYYLYQDSYEDAYKKRYAGLTPQGWHREDYHILQGTREEFFNGTARRHLAASGVPVENSKGEFGLGQHELNVKYSDALDMGDRHVVYKQCLKEIAESMGVSVTFMAKPHGDQAGSSCHIHMSLMRDGKNAFVGDKQLGPISNCSDEFKWFLGGWMKYTPELMVFYAPTVNSYKRFQSGSWAPTKIAWSKDNRTAPFRIVGSGKGLRIECRLPGADCNPYLGLAAGLASGLEGIKNKIEPPPPFTGDVYSSSTDLLTIPQTLRDAIEAFEKSEFAEKMLTKVVQEHYAHFYRTEQQAYEKAVTDWEKIRYFEQI